MALDFETLDDEAKRYVMGGWKLIDSETGEPRYFSTLGDVPNLCPKCGAYWVCDCEAAWYGDTPDRELQRYLRPDPFNEAQR